MSCRLLPFPVAHASAYRIAYRIKRVLPPRAGCVTALFGEGMLAPMEDSSRARGKRAPTRDLLRARVLLLASPRAGDEVKRFSRWCTRACRTSTSRRLAHHAPRPTLMGPPQQRTTRRRLSAWQRVSYPLDRPPSRVYNPAERPQPVG